ncbi:MAG: CHASE2 domain-containing protein [Burkholderiales bacterium]
MRKQVTRIVLGIALVLAFLAHAAGIARMDLIDRLEAIVYDLRMQMTMPRTVDSRIAIIDINEKSLREREHGGEGRWPWPRDRIAVLVDKLSSHYEVAVIAFDIVFSERDESSGIQVLERFATGELKDLPRFQALWAQLKPQLDYDDILAQGLKDRNVVLGYAFLYEQGEKGLLPAPVLRANAFRGRLPAVERYKGYTANLPALQKSAAGAGHFNPLPDADGITRRVPMLAEYGGAYYEPLSLATFRQLLGSPPIRPVIATEGASTGYIGLEALQIGAYTIPIDEDGAALVPYRGRRGSFPYHAAVDVMNERVDVADLKGKIVLVGTTAPGLYDSRATPVDPVYPGVEIHANLIAAMMDKSIPHKPPYASGAEFAMLALVGMTLALWLPWLKPNGGMLVSLTVLIAAAGLNIAVFHFAHVVLPLASVLVVMLLVFTLNMAYGFLVEERGKRQITRRFGQYVPPELVQEMAEDPDKFSMKGESREMTVLFSDVRGFTNISEDLEPQNLSQLMNEFLTQLSEVIYEHRGTIDKYIGDCIMAFWGAPLPDPQHARDAVLTALDMQRAMKALEPAFKAKNWPAIRIGVGVNTGRMSVGNMGSRIRVAYTVMGDAVNLASRLEGLTAEYGVDILVGEDTKNAIAGLVFREIDRVCVKGRDTAVAVFEPLGLSGEVPQPVLDEVARFHDALALYRQQAWDRAEERLLSLGKLSECRLYDVFLARIAAFRANPPSASWDGSFTFYSK